MKTFLSICAVLGGVVSCAPAVDAPSSLKSKQGLDVFDLSRPAVDAATLYVTELQMSHMLVKDVPVGSLYLAASGLSDFVEISVCHSGGCEPVRKEITNRIVFGPLPNERLAIKARACVEAERAATPGVLCGGWREIAWSQPPVGNAVLADLLSLREKYRAELEDMGGRIQEALAQFEKDLDKCNDRIAAGESVMRIRSIVQSVSMVGELVMGKMMGPGNVTPQGTGSAQQGGANEALVPALNVLGLAQKTSALANAAKTNSVPGTAEALAGIVNASAGLLGARLNLAGGPLGSIGALRGLADAAVNIATATEQAEALQPCFAQHRSETVTSAAKNRIEETRAKLAQVEAQIQGFRGELP